MIVESGPTLTVFGMSKSSHLTSEHKKRYCKEQIMTHRVQSFKPKTSLKYLHFYYPIVTRRTCIELLDVK